MCDCVVEVYRTNQDVPASSRIEEITELFGVALTSYLEAEDGGHSLVPMEVGSQRRARKETKGKKGHGEGKYRKSFGKYDKNTEYSKNNEYGKGNEKGKGQRGIKAKVKGKVEDEKPAPNSSFQGYCRSRGKVEGHKASECWQGCSASSGGSSEFFCEFSGRRVQRPHLQLRRQQCLSKRSMMRMDQGGSSA